MPARTQRYRSISADRKPDSENAYEGARRVASLHLEDDAPHPLEETFRSGLVRFRACPLHLLLLRYSVKKITRGFARSYRRAPWTPRHFCSSSSHCLFSLAGATMAADVGSSAPAVRYVDWHSERRLRTWSRCQGRGRNGSRQVLVWPSTSRNPSA